MNIHNNEITQLADRIVRIKDGRIVGERECRTMTWPFENDTDAIVKKLAKRSLQSEKRRNILIMITIAFSSCLIMSLALYVFGESYWVNQFYRGRLQAAVLFVRPELVDELSNDENIEVAGLTLAGPLTEIQFDRDRLSVNYYDETAFRMYSNELTDGRLPEQETEIAISSSFLEKQGIEPILGQSLSLDLGEHVPSELTVCGLIKDDDTNNVYDVLVSQVLLESYFGDTSIPYSVLIRMADSENMGTDELKQYILATMETYGFDDVDIAFSSSYFTTFENTFTDTLTTTALSILVLIACAAVIYSLFYISATGKVREYGKLRVVGITGKQMKRLVRREGRQLSLISIPLGIIVGCIIGYLLRPDGWYWPNTIKCAVYTAIAVEIAVMLSIRKPVQIAASVSPIEAVRITTTADITKPGDTKKLHRKITPHSLAGINFSRNRKRTRLTLFSLGFTGIMLMCAAAFALSIDPVDMAYQEMGNYEFIVSLSPKGDAFTPYVPVVDELQQNNPLDRNLITELTEDGLLRDILSIRSCTANIFFPDNVNVEDMPYYEIVGLSREYLESRQDALLSGTLDYDKLVEEHGIIIDDSYGMVKRFGHYEAVIGDTALIETDEREVLPFKVMAAVELQDKPYIGYHIYVPQDLLSTIKVNTTNFNSKLLLRTDSDDISRAEDMVYEICGDNPNLEIRSISEAISFMEQQLKYMINAAYGLAVIIGIFALINLINTLMTNLVSRQQEFGVLRSVGLSSRQLSKMLWAESFCYVLVTMAVTLTIGSVSGYVLCRIFSQIGVLGKLNYTFPLLPMLIFFTALTLIAQGYSVLAIRHCGKKSLSEHTKMME